jgi:hypothetical protein
MTASMVNAWHPTWCNEKSCKANGEHFSERFTRPHR